MKKIALLVLIVCIVSVIFGCTSQKNDVSDKLLPGIKPFMAQYSSTYGKVTDVISQPNWANGKRQQVNTTKGHYLFYMEGDEVVSVRVYDSKGNYMSQPELYHKDSSKLPETKAVAKSENIPAYKILFRVKLSTGEGFFADILVPEYSRQTSKDTLETTLRSIMKREGLIQATIYSTEEAYKANMSEKYSKANPKAKEGVLCSVLKNGEFYLSSI